MYVDLKYGIKKYLIFVLILIKEIRSERVKCLQNKFKISWLKIIGEESQPLKKKYTAVRIERI